jgi:aminocarboxymuconate-semialdehyde decarboxylase
MRMRVLECLIAMLGADRLMMGSDSPFPIGDLEPMRIVAAGLSAEKAAPMNGGVAAKLFAIG